MSVTNFHQIGLFSRRNSDTNALARAETSIGEGSDSSTKFSDTGSSWHAFFRNIPSEAQAFFTSVYKQFGAIGLQARKCLAALDADRPEELLNMIRNFSPNLSHQFALAEFVLYILKQSPQKAGYQKNIEALEKLLNHEKTFENNPSQAPRLER